MNKRPSAINVIWLYLVLLSILAAAWGGRMDATTRVSFEAAKEAVMLAIGLIGAMALWLGIMKVAEEAGLMRIICRAIRPFMTWLFPGIPGDHPAMSAMIMNISANLLGLGNAATPMGIKAMAELDKLNQCRGTATNNMCLFLAVNTSHISLPIGVIAVRAAAGAASPGAILIPTLLSTGFATVVAIVTAKLFARYSPDPRGNGVENAPPVQSAAADERKPAPQEAAESFRPGRVGTAAAVLVIVAFLAVIPYRLFTAHHLPAFNADLLVRGTGWLIPFLMGLFLLFGYFRGVKVYEALTEGAKEGFNIAVRILPFLVAIFVAIGMFRASGALDILAKIVNPLTSRVGFPVEALPVALLRPLSGSGSFAVMSEVISRAPDSFASFLVSVLQGSTETTFYVLAVYFGSVAIRRTRYALTVGLIADAAGIVAALAISHAMFR